LKREITPQRDGHTGGRTHRPITALSTADVR